MKNFEHIIDHYKDHIRLDNETAWNIICRFKDIVENKNDKDNEMFWCIMKDIHEELRGKHFDEVYATYQVDNIELYKEWFGEDNIENIKDKIIESAIVNWFEDEDAGIEKVWNYFRAI